MIRAGTKGQGHCILDVLSTTLDQSREPKLKRKIICGPLAFVSYKCKCHASVPLLSSYHNFLKTVVYPYSVHSMHGPGLAGDD